MMSVRPWTSIERESYWRPCTIKSSSQCHSNPFLVPSSKPPDPVKYLYDGHTYNLKKRVDICMRMDVVPVEYGTFAQTFHLTLWFFQFTTGITFKWDYVLWRIIDMIEWIGIYTKFRIYKVPPDPVRWSC